MNGRITLISLLDNNLAKIEYYIKQINVDNRKEADTFGLCVNCK